MVDSRATTSFVHSEVLQLINAKTVDILTIRVTLANGSYIDYSTAFPLYIKLSRNLQLNSSRESKTVHVGCYVMCCALPNLTSDVVLHMDWLHAINPQIDWSM